MAFRRYVPPLAARRSRGRVAGGAVRPDSLPGDERTTPSTFAMAPNCRKTFALHWIA